MTKTKNNNDKKTAEAKKHTQGDVEKHKKDDGERINDKGKKLKEKQAKTSRDDENRHREGEKRTKRGTVKPKISRELQQLIDDDAQERIETSLKQERKRRREEVARNAMARPARKSTVAGGEKTVKKPTGGGQAVVEKKSVGEKTTVRRAGDGSRKNSVEVSERRGDSEGKDDPMTAEEQGEPEEPNEPNEPEEHKEHKEDVERGEGKIENATEDDVSGNLGSGSGEAGNPDDDKEPMEEDDEDSYDTEDKSDVSMEPSVNPTDEGDGKRGKTNSNALSMQANPKLSTKKGKTAGSPERHPKADTSGNVSHRKQSGSSNTKVPSHEHEANDMGQTEDVLAESDEVSDLVDYDTEDGLINEDELSDISNESGEEMEGDDDPTEATTVSNPETSKKQGRIQGSAQKNPKSKGRRQPSQRQMMHRPTSSAQRWKGRESDAEEGSEERRAPADEAEDSYNEEADDSYSDGSGSGVSSDEGEETRDDEESGGLSTQTNPHSHHKQGAMEERPPRKKRTTSMVKSKHKTTRRKSSGRGTPVNERHRYDKTKDLEDVARGGTKAKAASKQDNHSNCPSMQEELQALHNDMDESDDDGPALLDRARQQMAEKKSVQRSRQAQTATGTKVSTRGSTMHPLALSEEVKSPPVAKHEQQDVVEILSDDDASDADKGMHPDDGSEEDLDDSTAVVADGVSVKKPAAKKQSPKQVTPLKSALRSTQFATTEQEPATMEGDIPINPGEHRTNDVDGEQMDTAGWLDTSTVESLLLPSTCFGPNVAPLTTAQAACNPSGMVDVLFAALNGIINEKEPGSDGLSPNKFAKYWHLVVEDDPAQQLTAQKLAITDPRVAFPAAKHPQGIWLTNKVSLWVFACKMFGRRFDPITGTVKAAYNIEIGSRVEARYNFAFDACDGEDKTLAQRLAQAFRHIRRHVDGRAKLLPWSKKSPRKPIQVGDDLPENPRILATYFPDVDTPRMGRRSWVKVRLTTVKDPKELTSDRVVMMADWCQMHQVQVYKNSLASAENPRQIGWLSYTGNFTNTEELSRLVKDKLVANEFAVDIGFKNKTVREISATEQVCNQHYENGGNWYNAPWQAVHVEVDEVQIRTAMEAMYFLFNQEMADRPAGMFVWFILMTKYARFGSGGSKLLESSRQAHVAVMRNLVQLTNNEIEYLDQSIDGMTCREFLLAKRSSRTGKRLFHAIDHVTSFQLAPTTVTAMVTKGHRDEAESFLNALPIVCCETNPNWSTWFLSTGTIRTNDYKYDAATQVLTSKTEGYLAEMESASQFHFDLLPEMLQEAVPEDVENVSFSGQIASGTAPGFNGSDSDVTSITDSVATGASTSSGKFTRTTDTNRSARSKMKDAQIAELTAALHAMRRNVGASSVSDDGYDEASSAMMALQPSSSFDSFESDTGMGTGRKMGRLQQREGKTKCRKQQINDNVSNGASVSDGTNDAMSEAEVGEEELDPGETPNLEEVMVQDAASGASDPMPSSSTTGGEYSPLQAGMNPGMVEQRVSSASTEATVATLSAKDFSVHEVAMVFYLMEMFL